LINFLDQSTRRWPSAQDQAAPASRSAPEGCRRIRDIGGSLCYYNTGFIGLETDLLLICLMRQITTAIKLVTEKTGVFVLAA
jgi:hypothetical protein